MEQRTPLTDFVLREGCQVSRPRENEVYSGEERDLAEVKLAMQCPAEVQVRTATGELLMQSKQLQEDTHGSLLRSFIAAESDQQAFLFKDLSLHYFQKNHHVWEREEALSQIIQMEVFDGAAQNAANFDPADHESMKQMQEEVSLAHVPARIIQRRIENFQLIYSRVSALFNGQEG